MPVVLGKFARTDSLNVNHQQSKHCFIFLDLDAKKKETVIQYWFFGKYDQV